MAIFNYGFRKGPLVHTRPKPLSRHTELKIYRFKVITQMLEDGIPEAEIREALGMSTHSYNSFCKREQIRRPQ